MCNLTIDINGFCPLRCKFCYQNLDSSMLPEEEIYRIVDSDPKFNIIEIGGGEPFIDPRIIRIIENLRNRNKSLHISTGGVVIPEGFMDLSDKLREGIQVQFSIHYSNQELFKTVAQQKDGSLFDKIIENLKLVKQKYVTVVSTTVYQENIDDLPNIVDLACSLEVPIRINPAYPIGNGRNVELLTAYQLDQLRGYLLTQKIMRRGMVESPLIHKNNCAAITNAYGIPKQGPCPIDCAAKKYVSPRGETFQCEFVDLK